MFVSIKMNVSNTGYIFWATKKPQSLNYLQ